MDPLGSVQLPDGYCPKGRCYMGCNAEGYNLGKHKMCIEPMNVPVTNIITHVQLLCG